MNQAFIQYSIQEITPLACYIIFVFYVFCDGFNLKPARKVLWAVYFLAFSYISYEAIARFDFMLIIPLSSLLALTLCVFQKREDRQKKEGL